MENQDHLCASRAHLLLTYFLRSYRWKWC